MGFTRRKSLPAGVEVLSDNENKRRNRLSKPLTNKSTTNLQALAQQNARSKNSSSGSLGLSPQITDEVREHIRSQIFSTDDMSPTKSFTSETSVGSGVASLVNIFEANASQQSLPLSPTKPRKPLSAITNSKSLTIRRKPVGDSSPKGDRLALLQEDRPLSIDSTSSVDTIHEPTPIPPQRRASFQPGVATRQPSGSDKPSKESLRHEALRDVQEESDLSFTEGDDQWVPPPRFPRTETPNSMEYTHLGGLKLGTLHIVNGRASPAFSELSKHLTAKLRPQASRELSSEYGDSEVEQSKWEDASVQFSSPDLSLPFTASIAEVVTNNFNTNDYTVETPTRTKGRDALLETTDKTSRLAMEYMAELEMSPYASSRSTSPVGSVIVTSRKMAEDEAFGGDEIESEVAEPRRDPDRRTLASWYSFEIEPSGGDSLQPTEIEDKKDSDPRQNSLTKRDYKSDSGYSSNASLGSFSGDATTALKVSVQEKIIVQQDPTPTPQLLVPHFKRVELVKELPDAPRSSAPSPIESYVSEPTPMRNSQENSRLTSKSDPAFRTESPTKEAKARKKLQKRKSSQPQALPRLAVLRQPVVHKVASIIDFTTIPPISTQVEERLRTRSQTLPELDRTYKSSQHIKNEASMSTLNFAFKEVTFPSPTETSPKKSLLPWQRLQTRRKSFVGKNQEDKSTHTLDNVISQAQAMNIISDFDITASSTVASPYKIAEDALSPRSKPSQWTKPETDRQLPSIPNEVGTRQPPRARSEVRGFGDNDQHKARSQSQPRVVHPQPIMREELRPRMQSYDMPRKPQIQPTFNDNRPSNDGRRTMMDDNAAAEFARQKNRFVAERENVNLYPQFNDRGGIPGRSLRPWSIASNDIPPVPVLPPARPTHRMSWQSQQSYLPPSQRGLRQEFQIDRGHWQENEMEHEYSSAPPPPPPHSPRPSIIEQADEPEELELAPPPPSHSPRPMDIEPEPEDHWAAQARAWKARRQSAGEALRKSFDEPRPEIAREIRKSFDSRPRYYEQAILDAEPVYPVIPARHPARDDDYQPHHRRAQTMQYPVHSQPFPSTTGRPLPTPRPNLSRAQSRNSAISYTSSLAEELHPEIQRPHPPPEFGRYSGGLTYGYERGSGFGGSAGTRSVSGKADAEFKGVALRGSYGVDLGDVPVIGVVKRVW